VSRPVRGRARLPRQPGAQRAARLARIPLSRRWAVAGQGRGAAAGRAAAGTR
jgi:hypothetical protein